MQDWQTLIRKRDFPMIAQGECGGSPMVYLDNAATTQCPRPVLWALENYWLEQHANVHRGVYCRSSQATAAMEVSVRSRISPRVYSPAGRRRR